MISVQSTGVAARNCTGVVLDSCVVVCMLGEMKAQPKEIGAVKKHNPEEIKQTLYALRYAVDA